MLGCLLNPVLGIRLWLAVCDKCGSPSPLSCGLLEKTDVSSRQELVGRIFLEDYLPRIAARTPLDSTRQFTHA